MYYRGALAALVVYDLANEQTFQMAKGWVNELQSNLSDEIVIALVGNKCDLPRSDKLSREIVADYAEQIGAINAETSAKSNIGMHFSFHFFPILFRSIN